MDNLCQTWSDGSLRHMVRHSKPYRWHTGIKLCLQVVEESVTPGVAKQCHDKMVFQNKLKQVSYRRTHTTYGTNRDCHIALPVLFTIHACLVHLLSIIQQNRYAATMGLIQCIISFSLMRAAIMCLCGARSSTKHASRACDSFHLAVIEGHLTY